MSLLLQVAAPWSKFLGLLYCKFPGLTRFFDLFLCFLAALVRLGVGAQISKGLSEEKKPKKLLQLYEFEACPYCKKVRETLCVLDLDAIIYPCPRETLSEFGVSENSRYRPEANRLGGKIQFPFLVDENTGTKLYESDAIIEYLWTTYGGKSFQDALKHPDTPFNYRFLYSHPKLNLLSLGLASFLRPLAHMGILRIPSKEATNNLELYSYEPSPFCRIVRERLSSLELPYILHNIAHGSLKKREKFKTDFGKMMVPYLIDPNSGWQGFESAVILSQLSNNYQIGEPPKQTLADYVAKGATASEKKTQ
jgi:glutathione S-transferase